MIHLMGLRVINDFLFAKSDPTYLTPPVVPISQPKDLARKEKCIKEGHQELTPEVFKKHRAGFANRVKERHTSADIQWWEKSRSDLLFVMFADDNDLIELAHFAATEACCARARNCVRNSVYCCADVLCAIDEWIHDTNPNTSVLKLPLMGEHCCCNSQITYYRKFLNVLKEHAMVKWEQLYTRMTVRVQEL